LAGGYALGVAEASVQDDDEGSGAGGGEMPGREDEEVAVGVVVGVGGLAVQGDGQAEENYGSAEVAERFHLAPKRGAVTLPTITLRLRLRVIMGHPG